MPAANSACRDRSARPARAARARAAPGRSRRGARRSRGRHTGRGWIARPRSNVRTGDQSMRLDPVIEISAGSERGRSLRRAVPAPARRHRARRRACASCRRRLRSRPASAGQVFWRAVSRKVPWGRHVVPRESGRELCAQVSRPHKARGRKAPVRAPPSARHATRTWRAPRSRQPRFCAAKSQLSSLSITAST